MHKITSAKFAAPAYIFSIFSSYPALRVKFEQVYCRKADGKELLISEPEKNVEKKIYFSINPLIFSVFCVSSYSTNPSGNATVLLSQVIFTYENT